MKLNLINNENHWFTWLFGTPYLLQSMLANICKIMKPDTKMGFGKLFGKAWNCTQLIDKNNNNLRNT